VIHKEMFKLLFSYQWEDCTCFQSVVSYNMLSTGQTWEIHETVKKHD